MKKAIWSVCLFICYFFLLKLLILYKFFTVNFINSDIFIIFLICFKSFPIVFNQLFLPGSGTTLILLVSFALLYFLFFISSKVLFVIYFSNCFNCSPCFDSSVFFYFIWKYIKELFLLDCLKDLWPLWAPLALWFPHLFFSFIYLFWTNDAVVLFSLSTFAEQVSNILQFPSVYNFPLHMHTYFLILYWW